VTRPKRPRALILGPTKELAEQIFRVARGLGTTAKFRTTCITSNGLWKTQREALSGPIDVVVATPTKLLKHLQVGCQWLLYE
jgi:superfamily II DNA/RNA helicase